MGYPNAYLAYPLHMLNATPDLREAIIQQLAVVAQEIATEEDCLVELVFSREDGYAYIVGVDEAPEDLWDAAKGVPLSYDALTAAAAVEGPTSVETEARGSGADLIAAESGCDPTEVTQKDDVLPVEVVGWMWREWNQARVVEEALAAEATKAAGLLREELSRDCADGTLSTADVERIEASIPVTLNRAAREHRMWSDAAGAALEDINFFPPGTERRTAAERAARACLPVLANRAVVLDDLGSPARAGRPSRKRLRGGCEKWGYGLTVRRKG